jgi:hypothetical protein
MYRFNVILFVALTSWLTTRPTASYSQYQVPSSGDTSIEAIFSELKNKTEQLFDAKRDSLYYESDNSVHAAGSAHTIYSIVRIGDLLNQFQKHALITYSLNDTILYVEIRQLIGKVWVRRFRNISSTKALNPLAKDLILFQDINGDGMKELLILTSSSTTARPYTNYKAWNYSMKDGFRERKNFEQRPGTEADKKRKK